MKLRKKSPVKTEWPPAKEAWRKPPPSTVSLMEQVLDKNREDWPSFFRPSMIHGCDRQNIFHYQNVPQGPEQQGNKMQRILHIGTSLHEMLQSRYFANHPGILFAPEARVEGYVGERAAFIRGSTDGVMVRRSDGYQWLLEIKTASPTIFKDLKAPKPEHILQASIYARFLGLHWISFFYLCKGTSNIKEFQVEVTEKTWSKVVKRVTHLKMYVDKKTLPDLDPETCDPNWCRYTKHCSKQPGGVTPAELKQIAARRQWK